MKYRSIVVGAIAMGAIGMIAPTDAGADGTGTDPTAFPAAPHPKFSSAVDLNNLGRDSWVELLTFSPDSRYLAIVDNPTPASSTIIIWDLKLTREQTRISGLPSFGGNPQVEMLWSPDGQYITYGSGLPMLFWDPLAGKVAKELRIDPPVLWSRYNKDGSKLLVNREPPGVGKGGFRIYDTRSWEFQDYGDDGLLIEALSWTADDKVLVAGKWPKFSVGRVLDGAVPQMSDALARLIDPSGQQASRSVLLGASAPRQIAGIDDPILVQTFHPDSAIVNYSTNRISLGPGKLVDGRTLEIFSYASDDNILTHASGGNTPNGKLPSGTQAFSPDGNYLYLLGVSRDGKAESLVLNVHTGAPAATFPGGLNLRALAVSPDGQRIAVGNGRSVDLYDVR